MAVEFRRCACGWPRPLVAVTLADGGLPTETLRVGYDCPQCGKVHLCGEQPPGTIATSMRARILEEALLRKLSGGG